MKPKAIYRLENLIISSTPNMHLCWLTFIKKGNNFIYQTGYAKLFKKKNLLVLMPIKNQKEVPFEAFIAFTELLQKLPKYISSKFYCKFSEFKAFKVYYTHSYNTVSEPISKELIISIFPDVLMFKKQILVEKISTSENNK